MKRLLVFIFILQIYSFVRSQELPIGSDVRVYGSLKTDGDSLIGKTVKGYDLLVGNKVNFKNGGFLKNLSYGIELSPNGSTSYNINITRNTGENYPGINGIDAIFFPTNLVYQTRLRGFTNEDDTTKYLELNYAPSVKLVYDIVNSHYIPNTIKGTLASNQIVVGVDNDSSKVFSNFTFDGTLARINNIYVGGTGGTSPGIYVNNGSNDFGSTYLFGLSGGLRSYSTLTSDVEPFKFSHIMTLGGNRTKSTFSFLRNYTGGSYNITGDVFEVNDLSTTSGTNSSKLFNLKVNGDSKFAVDRLGNMYINGSLFTGQSGVVDTAGGQIADQISFWTDKSTLGGFPEFKINQSTGLFTIPRSLYIYNTNTYINPWVSNTPENISNSLSTAYSYTGTARILSVRNILTEKFYVLNDSTVSKNYLVAKDSFYLKGFGDVGTSGDVWLTLTNTNAIDTGQTESAWIGLEMNLPTLQEYYNDQKMVNGHMELRIWYIDNKTKELKSQYGWKGLGMIETQSAYAIFHEITIRYMMEHEKQIKDLQKQVNQNKRSVLKHKIKTMEQRLENIESILSKFNQASYGMNPL